MDFFDSHAHLTAPKVIDDINGVLERAQAAGVTSIVNICTDKETLVQGLALSQQFPWVYTAAATTPHDVEREGEEVFSTMEKAAREGQLVAVGETGLDYYYEHSDREVQKSFFRKYLQLAWECRLPVIIHCREAFADLFEILDAEPHGPALLHCFTGTVDEAKQVLQRGMYLSLSGIVTFKKSEELVEVAAKAPLERLLIETDTPYLAPQSHRGKMNEPAFLPEIAAKVASIKNITLEEIAEVTSANARRLFIEKMNQQF